MRFLTVISLLLLQLSAWAELPRTTGPELAQYLRSQQPEQALEQKANLKTKAQNGKWSSVVLTMAVSAPTNGQWQSSYSTPTQTLTVTHNGDQVRYLLNQNTTTNINEAFSGSEFAIWEIGYDFLHWSQQTILPNPTGLMRGRSYILLESRGTCVVRSFWDVQTGGLLEAEINDFKGKHLKDFYPKSFQKVNGHWCLHEAEMRNLQTGTRSIIELTK